MTQTYPSQRWSRRSALAGALIWLVVVVMPPSEMFRVELIEKLLLLALLVVVPLGLSLAETARVSHERHVALYRVAVFAQPFAAVLALCSFLLPQGVWAALLACPWLGATGAAALSGLARLLSKRAMRAEEMCVDAGLVYVSVGGVWLVISRLGYQPLGFGDTIVLLTAVHFHYTGFAAPLLAGLAGRRALAVSSNWTRRVFAAASTCIIAGTPLVAAGITLSAPPLGLAGAIVVSTGLWLLAALNLARVVPALLPSTRARLLLVVSSVSSIIAMALACAYAYSLVVKRLIINIPHMAMTHGVMNALGFSLCGLLAWWLAETSERRDG
ncbi:MAG: YndJ family protein [Pyrinomonadaceae bacterium]